MTPAQIRQWRADHNFSPAALAEALGVARNTIYRWESGAMAPETNLAERLVILLAEREKRRSEPAHRIDLSAFDLDTAQEHGTIKGFDTSFWTKRTDAERCAWINESPNPMLALPWPWWSHGFEWYPPQRMHFDSPLPRTTPHYMQRADLDVIDKLMSQEKGTDIERLRSAVIYLCRRDFPYWLHPQSAEPLDTPSYNKLKKMMKFAEEAEEGA
jgi:DNA-binding XRE family transcriptional regulator